jgi:hypothetical protein
MVETLRRAIVAEHTNHPFNFAKPGSSAGVLKDCSDSQCFWLNTLCKG